MHAAELGFAEHLAGNRYFDRHFGSEAVKVLPGEYYVTTSDMLLVTVLGSCVSACIRDREKGLGGMNHFMLADSEDEGRISASARYGTYAMEILINHLLKLGARRSNLEAKVSEDKYYDDKYWYEANGDDEEDDEETPPEDETPPEQTFPPPIVTEPPKPAEYTFSWEYPDWLIHMAQWRGYYENNYAKMEVEALLNTRESALRKR